MSKSARKRQPVHRHAKPHVEKTTSPETQERTKRIIILGAIVILAAIPFAMGKYIEFNSPCAFDGGAYVYSAERILHGAHIGVDEISANLVFHLHQPKYFSIPFHVFPYDTVWAAWIASTIRYRSRSTAT
ncbi:MAG: hypothetical protein P8Z79_04820 [Sedimentisphaerales bacterium]